MQQFGGVQELRERYPTSAKSQLKLRLLHLTLYPLNPQIEPTTDVCSSVVRLIFKYPCPRHEQTAEDFIYRINYFSRYEIQNEGLLYIYIWLKRADQETNEYGI